MINIPVDEAYAFDMLSTLDIKFSKVADEDFDVATKLMLRRANLYEEICRGVGRIKTEEICESTEYKELYEVNSLIFDKVDEIKSNPSMLAKDIDDLNFLRFEKKESLQNKFFKVGSLSEEKVGYD